MHACDINSCERASGYKRMDILANLVTLRDVGIEITLAVKLGKVGKRTADRGAYTKNVPGRLSVNDRQSPRMRHADWTDVYIRPCLVGVVRRIAEHLCSGLQFRVNLQTDSGAVHIERVP